MLRDAPSGRRRAKRWHCGKEDDGLEALTGKGVIVIFQAEIVPKMASNYRLLEPSKPPGLSCKAKKALSKMRGS